jgi:hypothetical protein
MKIVVLVNGVPKGPFDLDGLKQAIQKGEIAPSALAWHEGQDNWTEVQNMPKLQPAPATKPGDAMASGAGVAEPVQPSSAVEANSGDAANVQWYYLVGDKTCGPSTTEEIRELLSSGAIPSATYVFREGMKDWAKAYSLEEIQRSLMSTSIRPESINAPPVIKDRSITSVAKNHRHADAINSPMQHGVRRRISARAILGAIALLVFLSWLYLEAIDTYNANVAAELKAQQARAAAALEAQQANDPVMREATRSAWSAIQATEAQLAKDNDTSEEGFHQRAYRYSQINTDNADPQLITNVAVEVTVAKEMATVIDNIHTASHESEESREGVRKGFSILGALLATALDGMADNKHRLGLEDAVNGGAALGSVVGDLLNGISSSSLRDDIKKKYGPELERCVGNVKILHERRQWLADYLSEKYKTQFLNAF